LPSFSAASELGQPSTYEVDMSIRVGFGDLVKCVEIAKKTYKYGFSKAYRAREYQSPKSLDVLPVTLEGAKFPFGTRC
jgi:hypothetical protein